QALFSPKWTVNLGAEQVVPVSDTIDLVGSVNTAWRGDQYGGFEFLDFEHIPSYWTTDLNLTLRTQRFSVGAFMLNVENKRRSIAPQLAPTGQAVTIYGAPRTYGMRLSANF
ncbi:MAG: TonB-dependent receptor, partial [Proteobacteria bacterium]|nr:TonB-dependent receptor [Pseudomonadota bacterium]